MTPEQYYSAIKRLGLKPSNVPTVFLDSEGMTYNIPHRRVGLPNRSRKFLQRYSGQAGGQPVAEVLTGKVNPSGRLPLTFPADIGQTPHPDLSGFGDPLNTPHTIRYDEGAEVGYRWFAKQGAKPLYAFGYGLSYTTFSVSDLGVSGGETITATFTVTNTGEREGADVPRLYLTDAPGEKRIRLLGFERVELGPGESREVTLTADPRLLARFDTSAGAWRIAGGTYRVAVGESADDFELTGDVILAARLFGS